MEKRAAISFQNDEKEAEIVTFSHGRAVPTEMTRQTPCGETSEEELLISAVIYK